MSYGGIRPLGSGAVNEYAITLPFRLNKLGVIDSTTNTSRIIADRVRTALSTNKGERVFRPEYGSALADELQNPLNTTPEAIHSAISDVFTQSLPNLTLQDVQVDQDELEARAKVTIFYQLPNQDVEQIQLSGFVRITENTTATEVNR